MGVKTSLFVHRIHHIKKLDKERRDREARLYDDDDKQDLRHRKVNEMPIIEDESAKGGDGYDEQAKRHGYDIRASAQKIERLTNSKQHYETRKGQRNHQRCVIFQGFRAGGIREAEQGRSARLV